MIGELERQFVDVVALTIHFARVGRCVIEVKDIPAFELLPASTREMCVTHGSYYVPEFLGAERCEKSIPSRDDDRLAARYWGAIETANDCTLAEIVQAARAANSAPTDATLIQIVTRRNRPSAGPKFAHIVDHEGSPICGDQLRGDDWSEPQTEQYGSWKVVGYGHKKCDAIINARAFDPAALFAALAVEGIAKGEQDVCAGCGRDISHGYAKNPGRERGSYPFHTEDNGKEVACAPRPIPSWFDEHARFELVSDCPYGGTKPCDRREFIIPPLRLSA